MNEEVGRIMEIAARHGLKLNDERIEFNESGLDFQVVLSQDEDGDEWILRLPRREDVMPRTEMEKKALDLILMYVQSFQVPDWRIYTSELIAYKKLKGVPAGTIDHEIGNYVWELDISSIPESYHQSLGRVLAELHSIPVSKASEYGLLVQSPEESRQLMRQRMNDVRDYFGVGENLWNRWQKWLNDDELWPGRTGLIHGDVHAGHIMIDEEAKVTGLIDWTEAKVSDVSYDFIFSYQAFGEEGLDHLIQAYKDAGGYIWPKMKEHIIELVAAYPVSIAEFARISGIDEYIEMAKNALETNRG